MRRIESPQTEVASFYWRREAFVSWSVTSRCCVLGQVLLDATHPHPCHCHRPKTIVHMAHVEKLNISRNRWPCEWCTWLASDNGTRGRCGTRCFSVRLCVLEAADVDIPNHCQRSVSKHCFSPHTDTVVSIMWSQIQPTNTEESHTVQRDNLFFRLQFRCLSLSWKCKTS